MENKILCGDCLEVIKTLEDNSIDLILTDPPYELGFMGKKWDNTGIAFNIDLWKEALRVLKPGGYLMAFSGTRTYHRMTSAIEDAGFIIKDMISWNYSSGFPKALDISKALDKKLGAEREIIGKKSGKIDFSKANKGDKSFYESAWSNKDYIDVDITAPASDIAKQYEGYKTALKPAHEPIVLAMKPLNGTYVNNVMEYGTGALNIDGTRIEYENTENPATNPLYRAKNGYKIPEKGKESNGTINFTSSKNEVNENGRYPANFIISEDIAPILDEQSGFSKSSKGNKNGRDSGNIFSFNRKENIPRGYNDCGGASRFFYNAKIEDEDYIPFYYAAKCSKKERGIDNNHPTVKPTSILKYLAKLGLPPYNSVVLDMFGGSGSTGLAIEQLNKELGTNHKYILIEREKDYIDIIEKRLGVKSNG